MLIASSAQAQNLFVSYQIGIINEYTPDGVQSSFASGLSEPLGLTFDSAGNLYEADLGSGNIYKFTPQGVRSTFASGFPYPVALAFDSAGNLFVSDDTKLNYQGNIYKVSCRVVFKAGIFCS